MEKAIIGIVAKPALVQDMWHYMEIVDDIRLALQKNDALAVGIIPTEKRVDFKTLSSIWTVPPRARTKLLKPEQMPSRGISFSMQILAISSS